MQSNGITVSREDDKSGDKKEKKGLWLNAWHDPLAGIRAYSQCMDLADLNGDGDYKLLIADESKRLKIYKGTTIAIESALMDQPVGICTYYMDYTMPRRPAIAVASGPYLFIYRNYVPYFKFTLPPITVHATESDVWARLRLGKVDISQAIEELEQARDQGVELTNRSVDLLALEDETEIIRFIESNKNFPLVQQTVITCIAVLKKDKDEEQAVGCLVIGTEKGHVLILDPSGASIIQKVVLPSVPSIILSTGLFDVEYRIIVACRNGNVYTIKNGELTGVVIEMEAQPCALARIDKHILIATMGNVIHCHHFRGKKQYSLYLPAPITNMEVLDLSQTRNMKGLIVALANGELRVYNGKNLIDTVQTNDVVTGMKFGTYGRENNTLILTYRSGGMTIKILPRHANLDFGKVASGPPPEQDIPLNVPKKSSLYIEHAQRERDFGVEMHRVFQRELCKLRLATARAYVKILTDGQGPLSYTVGSSMRLTAQVQGLGPLFKIKLSIQNTGTKHLSNVPIIFSYNQEIYNIKSATITVPVLVPSLQYKVEVPVECVDDSVGADAIKVFVCNPNSSIPIITAIVNMPLPDMLMQ